MRGFCEALSRTGVVLEICYIIAVHDAEPPPNFISLLFQAKRLKVDSLNLTVLPV